MTLQRAASFLFGPVNLRFNIMTVVTSSSSLAASLQAFLDAFYRASDARPADPLDQDDATHKAYASFFAGPKFDFLMLTTTAHDEAGVKAWRAEGWKGVQTREHKISDVITRGELRDEDSKGELMLYGTVDYGLENGTSGHAEWAGRMELVKVDAQWKMRFYQVWVVSSGIDTV